MTYNLTGPLDVGTVGTALGLFGNITTPNVTTTQGNLLTISGTGILAPISTGTSGQVLTSLGAGTQPTFQTPTVLSLVNAGTGADVGKSLTSTTLTLRSILTTLGQLLITENADDITINLATTGVTPGIYVKPNLTIDSNGRITFSSSTTTGFSAFKSGNQAITTSTNTAVGGWSIAGPDGYNQSGGAFVPATGLFTVPIAGSWRVSAQIIWQVSNTGPRRFVRFSKNGTFTFGAEGDPNVSTNFGDGQSLVQKVDGPIYMAVGDVGSISVLQNSGGNSNVLATSALSGIRTCFSMSLEAGF